MLIATTSIGFMICTLVQERWFCNYFSIESHFYDDFISTFLFTLVSHLIVQFTAVFNAAVECSVLLSANVSPNQCWSGI